MKQFIKPILFLIFFGFSSLSLADGDNGHGGGGWVCRNKDDSIRWVKLVDIFELKNRWGLTPDEFTKLAFEQQLKALENKVSQSNPGALKTYQDALNKVKTSTIFSSEIAIVRINDAHFVVTPAQELCIAGNIDYEVIANYTPDGKILVANLLYEKLTVTEQVALYFHETTYSIYRELLGHIDSDAARKTVSYWFSTVPPENLQYFGINYAQLLKEVLPQFEKLKGWIVPYYKRNIQSNLYNQTDFGALCELLRLFGPHNYSHDTFKCPEWVFSTPGYNQSTEGSIHIQVVPHLNESTMSVEIAWVPNKGSAIIKLQYIYEFTGFNTLFQTFLSGKLKSFTFEGVALTEEERLDFMASAPEIAIGDQATADETLVGLNMTAYAPTITLGTVAGFLVLGQPLTATRKEN